MKEHILGDIFLSYTFQLLLLLTFASLQEGDDGIPLSVPILPLDFLFWSAAFLIHLTILRLIPYLIRDMSSQPILNYSSICMASTLIATS